MHNLKVDNLKVGLVTDLQGYKEYFDRFDSISSAKVMEIHLLESDLDASFEQKLIELRHFIMSRAIESIAFHSVDRIVQAVLFDEGCSQDDLRKFELLTSALKNWSRQLRKEVILIIHLGGKYARNELSQMSPEKLKNLRRKKAEQAGEAYERIRHLFQDSYVIVALENSPPLCAATPEDHLQDIAFEDILPRLGETGAFVFDICHAAMAVAYFQQNEVKIPPMEAMRDVQGKAPFSLQSLENYIALAGRHIRWMHLSNATGFLGHDEGHEVGVAGGIIPFKKMLKLISSQVKDPVGVLEIVNGHRDYGSIERSYHALQKLSTAYIKGQEISKERCFFIAEVASSHCGDKEKLKSIIKLYAQAQADGIKLQIFKAEALCSRQHPGLADLQKIQLSPESWKEVLTYAKQFSPALLADVFDEESADLAESFVDAFSIHASDLSNPFLLKHVAGKGKPMLLYVGGATLEEIKAAVSVVEPFGVDMVLVYGLQNFPTKIENIHLQRIKLLEQKFHLPVCYHDHTDAETELARDIAVQAFAYGASLVEKHVTDDRSLKGFDYMSSLNPPEFALVVKKLREFEKTLGSVNTVFTDADREYRKKMKKFMVAKRDLQPGEIFSLENITFKRVMDGQFQPFETERVLGRRALHFITKDHPIVNTNVERKAAILVPVRMKSTRLPRKALLEMAGDTTIGHMLERLRRSTRAELMLCTSTLPDDACLIEVAKNKGIPWFAGDPDDVMDRFLKAAEVVGAELIVRATGDNPCMDPEFIDRMIQYHIEHQADYTSVEDVPLGFNAEVITVDVLKKARSFVTDPKDTEYMTWFIKDPKHFKVMIMPVPEEEKGNYRLTLDFSADLEVIRKVFEHLGNTFTVKEAVAFLKEHPEIVALNAGYQQHRQPPKLAEIKNFATTSVA